MELETRDSERYTPSTPESRGPRLRECDGREVMRRPNWTQLKPVASRIPHYRFQTVLMIDHPGSEQGPVARKCSSQLINWLVARDKRPTKWPSIVATVATGPCRGPSFVKRDSERSEQFVAYARLEPPRTSESYLRIVWTAGAVFDDAIITA